MSHLLRLSDVLAHFSDVLGPYWQRRRGTLGPPQVFLSLMVMSVLGSKGYQRTIAEMKERLGSQLGWGGLGFEPSPSALSQARKKLDAERCAAISSRVLTLCSTARAHAAIGYGGFRLLAVDGTKLALPALRAMREHFGGPSDEAGTMQGPQAGLTVLWDVGANMPVAWQLGPYRVSERVHALALVEQLQPNDLLIGDRGIPSRNLLTEIFRRKANVLMRMRCSSSGSFREVLDFTASDKLDDVITIGARDHHGNRTNGPTLSVRLLRHTLADGSVAIFLTSLTDQHAHPASTLIQLYAQRWRIETGFRELKLWHGLERFHTRRPAGIAQEVCALMVFQMLASELEARARLTLGLPERQVGQADPPVLGLPQPVFRFNRRLVADEVVNILLAGSKGDADIDAVFHQAMLRLWRYRQTVRPGRSFPRRRISPLRGWKGRGTKGKGRP